MEQFEKIVLTTSSGARAEIALQGAHLLSWIPEGGSERLFLSAASQFRSGAAIRGGVPVIFPQFGTFGSLPKHGFARILPWIVEETLTREETAIARLTQHSSAASRRIWDYPYTLSLTIELGGDRLGLRLEVTNTGETPFAFTGALHTYLRVDDLATTTLSGLAGQTFIDTVGGGQRRDIQTDSLLRFTAETDRIYPDAPSPLCLQDSHHRIEISSIGFPDCVVWNPGPHLAANLPDLEPGGDKRFVCVEAALAVQPVTLQPGQTWNGIQTLHSGPSRKEMAD